MKIWDRIKEVFSLDYRSLALMRIGMGVTLVLDLIQRLEYLRAHYSDAGILPRSALFDLWGGNWNISLHSISGMWQVELVLFIIALIAALALIVGYRTTLATVISWVLLISVQNRNPLILQGGDVIFRVVLFWMMFLPLGKYLSIDSLKTQGRLLKKKIFDGSTFAYAMQIVFFYFFSGIMKTGIAWHNGSAVYYTLSIDQLVTSVGHALLSFPGLLTILTFAVLCLEIGGSLLLLSPWKNGPIRTIVLFLFILMQIGLNSALHLGLFGLISIVVTLGLLPSWFWEKIYGPLRKYVANKKSRSALTIYYDQNCGFCFKAVYMLKRILWLPETVAIRSSEEDTNIAGTMGEKNSWIVEDGSGAQFYKTEALQQILRASPLFFWCAPIVSIPFVHKLGDRTYERIAQSRLLICGPGEAIQKKKSALPTIKNCVLVFLTIYVLAWNIQTLESAPKIIPKQLEVIAELPRLDQKWNMFAPTPLTEDGWYVFPGRLTDGTEVDVFRGGATVSYVKPARVADLYANQRWQKYLMNLWGTDDQAFRLYYGKYICREWNSSHPSNKQLSTFQMVFILERTKPDYQTPNVAPTTIWNHHCF